MGREVLWINYNEPLALIEQLLDDNRLVFRYNAKLNQFSLMCAR